MLCTLYLIFRVSFNVSFYLPAQPMYFLSFLTWLCKLSAEATPILSEKLKLSRNVMSMAIRLAFESTMVSHAFCITRPLPFSCPSQETWVRQTPKERGEDLNPYLLCSSITLHVIHWPKMHSFHFLFCKYIYYSFVTPFSISLSLWSFCHSDFLFSFSVSRYVSLIVPTS